MRRVLTVLLLSAAAVGCGVWRRREGAPPPPLRYEPGEWHRGLYLGGWETSAFRPCGSDDVWWIRGGSDRAAAKFFGGVTRAARAGSAPPDGWERAYVEVRGDTSARGEYGAAGSPYLAVRELTLRGVRVVRPVAPADTAGCRAPAPDPR